MESSNRNSSFGCICHQPMLKQGFKKIMAVEDIGLTIYQHSDRKIDTGSKKNNEDVFIVCNQNCVDISNEEMMEAFDKYAISCPRCKEIISHVHSLMDKMAILDKNNTLAICDHCITRALSMKRTCECEGKLRKFLSSNLEDNINDKDELMQATVNTKNNLVVPVDKDPSFNNKFGDTNQIKRMHTNVDSNNEFYKHKSTLSYSTVKSQENLTKLVTEEHEQDINKMGYPKEINNAITLDIRNNRWLVDDDQNVYSKDPDKLHINKSNKEPKSIKSFSRQPEIEQISFPDINSMRKKSIFITRSSDDIFKDSQHIKIFVPKLRKPSSSDEYLRIRKKFDEWKTTSKGDYTDDNEILSLLSEESIKVPNLDEYGNIQRMFLKDKDLKIKRNISKTSRKEEENKIKSKRNKMSFLNIKREFSIEDYLKHIKTKESTDSKITTLTENGTDYSFYFPKEVNNRESTLQATSAELVQTTRDKIRTRAMLDNEKKKAIIEKKKYIDCQKTSVINISMLQDDGVQVIESGTTKKLEDQSYKPEISNKPENKNKEKRIDNIKTEFRKDQVSVMDNAPKQEKTQNLKLQDKGESKNDAYLIEKEIKLKLEKNKEEHSYTKDAKKENKNKQETDLIRNENLKMNKIEDDHKKVLNVPENKLKQKEQKIIKEQDHKKGDKNNVIDSKKEILTKTEKNKKEDLKLQNIEEHKTVGNVSKKEINENYIKVKKVDLPLKAIKVEDKTLVNVSEKQKSENIIKENSKLKNTDSENKKDEPLGNNQVQNQQIDTAVFNNTLDPKNKNIRPNTKDVKTNNIRKDIPNTSNKTMEVVNQDKVGKKEKNLLEIKADKNNRTANLNKKEPIATEEKVTVKEDKTKQALKEESLKSAKEKEENDKKARTAAEARAKEAALAMAKAKEAAIAVAKAKDAAIAKSKLDHDNMIKIEKKEQQNTNKVEKITQNVDIKNIKVRKLSNDDRILKLVKLNNKPTRLSDLNVTPIQVEQHKYHKGKSLDNCVLCKDSELELDVESIDRRTRQIQNAKDNVVIIGTKIFKYKHPLKLKTQKDKEATPLLFKTKSTSSITTAKMATKMNTAIPIPKVPTLLSTATPHFPKTTKSVSVDQETGKGVIRYALSDRYFIEKGWTVLPTERIVRKINVYRMRPAHPEFDWFANNKHKGILTYTTGEKLAEIDDAGRGQWYYRNGRLALDYYDAEELNAQQRYVVYSNGKKDEHGSSRPGTILAAFDCLGNGVVFDHSGKIRLKYNQTEGVILDTSLGPVSHWKWHTLNEPPVLQQVMIDTYQTHKDPDIAKLGSPPQEKFNPENDEILAIEFENSVKEKTKKLSQKFKPFQIKMKAMKINENFSLKILDQATVYLIFRDGTKNLKLDLGMILNHQEIIDTDTADVGQVSTSIELLPAKTDSLAGLQATLAHAQNFEKKRLERERRLIRPHVNTSVDKLKVGISKPIQQLPIAPSSLYYTTTGSDLC